MTINVSKPEFNLRDKLNQLDYGHVPYEKMPAGSVIQATYRKTSTQSISTSTNWAGTDVYATIYPRYANSKMLIMASGGMTGNSGGSEHSYTVGCFTIYKSIAGDTYTATDTISQGQQRYHLDAHKYIPLSINFLDERAGTTDYITYKVYFKRAAGSSGVNTNRDSNNSSQMILMEIKQ